MWLLGFGVGMTVQGPMHGAEATKVIAETQLR